VNGTVHVNSNSKKMEMLWEWAGKVHNYFGLKNFGLDFNFLI